MCILLRRLHISNLPCVLLERTKLESFFVEGFFFLQIEPIRNFFAALFLASIRMLIHVHFLWNHIDMLLAAVILVIVIKAIVVTSVVKGFGYTTKTSLLVGMSLAQSGEFAFVRLSRASNLHLVEVGVRTSQMKMDWVGGFSWELYNEDINSYNED